MALSKRLDARILMWLLLAMPMVAYAGGVDRLRAFFKGTTTMKAQFHQTVLDQQGRKLQEVNGVMQLQRPGKFRWDYAKPYVQIVVGDGQKVWLYDPELNQVTVRALDKMLGSSPAALLAGNRDMDKVFALKDDVRQDGMEWVEATPKDQDSGFAKLLLGFREDAMAEMEVHDNFGQVTVIEFSHIEHNIKLNSKAFSFTPPAGADVVGE
jgi:outer membrane lipoprotein carrier protein